MAEKKRRKKKYEPRSMRDPKGRRTKYYRPFKKRPVSKKHKYPGLKRYNKIQKILSTYTKEEGLKLGKFFSKKASEVYQRTKEDPIKYVSDNIDVIYTEFIEPVDIERAFPDGFEFYHFAEKMMSTALDGVTIGIEFSDSMDSFSFKGLPMAAVEWYNIDGLYRHLRAHYDEKGDYPRFIITNTDNKTYVNYTVETGTDLTRTPTPSPETPLKPKPDILEVLQQKIDLEKERQKTYRQKTKEHKQKEKTAKKQIAAYREQRKEAKQEIKRIERLKSAGLSKKEIKQRLIKSRKK